MQRRKDDKGRQGGLQGTLLSPRTLCACTHRHPHHPHFCRLGGRIHTYELQAGSTKRPVDLGATFVCGECACRPCLLLPAPPA